MSEFDPWRWFGPDVDGNVMDDAQLAYAIEADSLTTDFVFCARRWSADLAAARDEVARLRTVLGAIARSPFGDGRTCAHCYRDFANDEVPCPGAIARRALTSESTQGEGR